MKDKQALTYLLRLTVGTKFSSDQEGTLTFVKIMEVVDKLSYAAQQEFLQHMAEIITVKPFTTEQSDIILQEILNNQKHQTCICCLGDDLNKIVEMVRKGKVRLRPSAAMVEEITNSGKEKAAYESEEYQSFLKVLRTNVASSNA